jgi:peroxiredoxin Q/BCP
MWFASPLDPKPGDAAPPFSLPAHDGTRVKLTDFRGRARVVLAFYGEDDAAGSRRTLGALEQNLARFKALRAQVLAVSHNDSDSQARFAAKLGLHFPLLSDPEGAVARPYGAKGRLSAFARRAFVIDGNGLMRLVVKGQPDADDLIKYLDGLHGDLPEA